MTWPPLSWSTRSPRTVTTSKEGARWREPVSRHGLSPWGRAGPPVDLGQWTNLPGLDPHLVGAARQRRGVARDLPVQPIHQLTAATIFGPSPCRRPSGHGKRLHQQLHGPHGPCVSDERPQVPVGDRNLFGGTRVDDVRCTLRAHLARPPASSWLSWCWACSPIRQDASPHDGVRSSPVCASMPE
jgi:hypothetical protein